jgi:hypothetical protein
MNGRLIGLLLSGATLLAACGSDGNPPTAESVCGKFSSEWPSVLAKVQTGCAPITTNLAPYTRLTDAQTCTAVVTTSCSPDIPKIDTFLDCMNGLPACDASNVETWGNTCFTQVSGPSGPSRACLAALTAQ